MTPAQLIQTLNTSPVSAQNRSYTPPKCASPNTVLRSDGVDALHLGSGRETQSAKDEVARSLVRVLDSAGA